MTTFRQYISIFFIAKCDVFITFTSNTIKKVAYILIKNQTQVLRNVEVLGNPKNIITPKLQNISL